MEEYRKIIKVHPLLLFKEDLLELERMVINNFDCNRVKIEIAVTSDGHNIKTDSVVNLLENITQDYDADAFEFVAFGYNSEDKIIRSITLRMFHGYVDYQIAGDNEVWFLGIIKILNSFLKARKPKYSFFRTLFPFISGFFIYLLLTLLVSSIKNNRYILLSLCI